MNHETIGLEFPGNEVDEGEGLAESGIETYRNAPYVGTARECGQNSADVRASSAAVRVSFDLIKIPPDDLPAIGQYQMAVELCLKKAKRNKKEKEIKFFSQAKSLLAADEIRILRISDYGTTGAKGPATEGKPWHSLVKSNAVSEKTDSTAGGSFGIGKSAVFTISQLQTVFYSTIYIENGDNVFLAQGKTRFTSHEDQKGNKKRATGYWGQVRGFMPVEDANQVPQWLRRSEPGTSVFAIGSTLIADWRERMAYSVIRNFFCAIDRKDLEFTLDDSGIVIDNTTIDQLLHNSTVEKAAENLNDSENLELTKSFYSCLKSPATIEKKLNIPFIGLFSVKVLVKDGLQKRIAIIRNGMYITDNLKFFGQSFERFPMYRDFVAIVEPISNESIEILRELEDPKHENFSPARIQDESRRKTIDKGMKELGRQVREVIKDEAVTHHETQTSIDELSEFFAMDDKQESLPDESSEDNIESIKYEAKKVTRKKPLLYPHQEGDTGGAGSAGGKGSGRGAGAGGGAGSGKDGTGARGQSREIALEDVRNIFGTGTNGKSRTLFLTPLASGDVRVLVRAFGLNESTDLTVIGTSLGSPDCGNVVLTAAQEGERISFDIELAEPYSGPIEITAISCETDGVVQ